MQTLLLERTTRNLRGAVRSTPFSQPTQRGFGAIAYQPALVLIAELALAACAYFWAVVLLTSAYGTAWEHAVLQATFIEAVGFAFFATLFVHLYRRSLRHANLLDVRTLAEAVILNSICLAAFTDLRDPLLHAPAALFVLDAAILMLFWGFLHFSFRVWRAQRAVQRKHGCRTVIVGAGNAGLTLLKDTALDPESPILPVALADDDPQKRGRAFYGVPVLGNTRDLARIASETRAEQILICIPSATHSQMHGILDACRRLNLPVRSLPSLPELIQRPEKKSLSPRDLRGPRIEHLLNRDEFSRDIAETRRLVENRTVLVTGAGGSIGSELARQIAAASPRRLLLLDKAENSLFYANLEIAELLGARRVKPILADLSANGRARTILKNERPDMIFHAAAHKHVSMIELHPEEAIRNNVLGTRNVAEAALEVGVESFVNISTDKAVDPRNYMGISKKLTELCIQELARKAAEHSSRTRFSNVRFGNVAGSSGSVIRLFWEQIQRGGPIRITDPQASRYFMSIPEAVHLILGAAELGTNGETFVFEMGEPFNIYELAKTMALFSGLRPHKDIAIEFTGLRKGEKVAEQLWDYWEHPVATPGRRILKIRERDPRSPGILPAIRRMEQLLTREDSEGLIRFIGEIFPFFGVRETPVWRSSPAPQPTVAHTAMNSVGAA